MRLRTWLYRGGRPNRLARTLDRWTSSIYARGASPDHLVTLEVPGGHSGRTIALPLVMVAVDGNRYLVSMLGKQSNWVQNVKAAGGNVTLRHGRREDVHLEEIAPDRRAPLVKAYLKRSPGARAHISVDQHAPLAEFEHVAPSIPVFRVMPREVE